MTICQDRGESWQVEANAGRVELTSTDEADGAEQACLCVIHLQGQQLTSKSKDQVCEWTKASIMHLGPVQSQAVWECHCILFWGVTSTYPQHLREGRNLRRKRWRKEWFLRYLINKLSHVSNKKASGGWTGHVVCTRISRHADLRRVIWSAMVSVVKPGSRLANSTIFMIHLVDSSLNLSHRPKSSCTLWSELEF